MIYYITQTLLSGANAQSVQIRKTVEFMHRTGSVKLISPSCRIRGEVSFPWCQISLQRFDGRFKYFCFLIVLILFHRYPKKVYTRDILVALVYVILGRKVTYEAHQSPSLAVRLIVHAVKNVDRFRLVAISDALRRYYVDEFFIPAKRSLTIRSAVDFEKYESAVEAQPLQELILLKRDQKVILHSGSVGAGRGTELFSVILDEFPNLVILQLGGTEPELELVRATVKSDRLLAVPRVECEDRLIALQRSADYSFFPMSDQVATAWCCSPMKIFEYAALGKPLISTAVGAVSELISDENAYVFDSSRPESLIVAIRDLLGDEAKANRKATNLKEVAAKNTWELRAHAIRASLE